MLDSGLKEEELIVFICLDFELFLCLEIFWVNRRLGRFGEMECCSFVIIFLVDFKFFLELDVLGLCDFCIWWLWMVNYLFGVEIVMFGVSRRLVGDYNFELGVIVFIGSEKDLMLRLWGVEVGMECLLLCLIVLVFCLVMLELFFEFCDDVLVGGVFVVVVVRLVGFCFGLKLLGYKRFKVSCDIWCNDFLLEGGLVLVFGFVVFVYCLGMLML